MNKSLKIIEKYLVFLAAFASPILVLPIFPDFYNTPKLVFLSAIVGLLILVKSAQIIANQKLEVSFSSFDLPVLLIALSYLASGIFKSPNKAEAFFLPGSATLAVALSLYYFFANQAEGGKRLVSQALIISAVLASLVSLLSVVNLNEKLSFLPQFAKVENFNLIGSSLLTFIFLATIIPMALQLMLKENAVVKRVLWGISLIILTVATAANLYQILPGKKFSPKMPPTKISWEIAIDSIKDSPIFGAGAGNYLTAFNRFRPLAYNSLDIWQVKFTNSSNFFLHLMTETGLLGLFSLTILFLALIKIINSKKDKEENNNEFDFDFLKIGLLISTLALFVSGPYLPPLLVFFSYLAANSKTRKVVFNFEAVQKEQRQTSIIASSIVSLPLIVSVIVFFYFGSKTVMAEYNFKKSLDAVAKNDGNTAITMIIKAIQQNPKIDRYHTSFAQMNFLIAQNLAQKNNNEKLTDEEKNTISQLIQQSITDGKNGVSLNPQRADNWELLGNLYKQIMAFAQGADQFAIQALSQAVALDPINPNTRINLGGVYFAIGDYESAIDSFKLAVAAKPDYANARYNLALAYREKGETDKAIAEMNNTLSLLEKDSNDWQLVKKELDDLQAKKESAKKETGKTSAEVKPEELTPPQKTEKVVEPQVNLPEDAAPPSPEAIPTPTPNPTNP
jgi:tetratricopeptide (TPR) repeat protein